MAKRINKTKKPINNRATNKGLRICIDCGKAHQTGVERCNACIDIQAEIARQKRLNM